MIYEDCLVFATVGPREDGWLGRLVGGSSALDAQFFRIGQEQATVEPQRLALRSTHDPREVGACPNASGCGGLWETSWGAGVLTRAACYALAGVSRQTSAS